MSYPIDDKTSFPWGDSDPNDPAVPHAVSFLDALNQTESTKRILLLGNGFSLARDQAFNYASNPSMEGIRKKVIDDLRDSLTAINGMKFTGQSIERPVYELNRELSKNVRKLKWELVNLVASYHPEHINVNQSTVHPRTNFDECVDFLAHFIGRSLGPAQIYTLNYDLMLYWVLMHDLDLQQTPPQGKLLNFKDGFSGKSPAGPTWDASNKDQNIFYLHGALHLKFQTDPVLTGLVNLGKFVHNPISTVLPQIRQAISSDKMPLLVLEGEASHKDNVIRNDPYLAHGFSEFIKALNDSKASLFVFGCSLSEVDKHILDAILGSKCELFISSYGTPGNVNAPSVYCDVHGRHENIPSSIANHVLIYNYQSQSSSTSFPGVTTNSAQIFSTRFKFFCAESANVW